MDLLGRRIGCARTLRLLASLLVHAGAFRLSRSIFRQRGVDNLGKRPLLKSR
jgi:hypothetical protein